jgi:NAD(P)-dependent dehydrogenase (short-subunit alcohol dehydrogenase family)
MTTTSRIEVNDSMDQPTVVITGANRGIGLEFVRQWLERGAVVHATHRTTMGGLSDLEHPLLTCHRVDVRSEEDLVAMFDRIEGHVDVLINNAGVSDGRWGSLEAIDVDVALDVLAVNALAPVRVVQHASAKLRRGSKIAMISSLMGSIGDCESGRSYAYRASKTALNMLTVAMKPELAERGVATVLLHPGWVQTDMGGPHAPVNTVDSVAGMLACIDELTVATSGSYRSFDGTILPW